MKRSLPRIPRIIGDDFAEIHSAGQQLLDLHIGYDDVEPYPLRITGDRPSGQRADDLYDWFRVEKLHWAGTGRTEDKSSIVYNPWITLSGIPDEAHRHMLGARSGLEWVIERYRVKTDSRPAS